MADIEILRGYVPLSDNSVHFGIRVTNNNDTVITDVEVILDYPEFLFKLQGDRIQRLGNIPPTVSRTAKFVLKPTSCVHKERIEADVKYRDSKNEKHMLSMRPKEIDCVCPFLRAKPLTKGKFSELARTGHVVDTGINFQGVSKDQLTSFLNQTCASRFHKVDEYSIDDNNVLYLSSESVVEKAYYLLTVIIKEQDGLTQIMLRAVSDQNHGIHGFLNEIVSELKHMVQTVNSSREIGIIKHEQVINIIDSVVQRTSFSMKDGSASVSIKDSVVQRNEIATSSSSVNITDSVVQHTSIKVNDEKKKEDEIKILEATRLKAAEEVEKKKKEEERRLRVQAEIKRLEEERLRKEHEKQELRSGKKKRRRLFIPVMFIIVLAGYWMFSPLLADNSDSEIKIASDSYTSYNSYSNIKNSDEYNSNIGNSTDSGNLETTQVLSTSVPDAENYTFVTKWGSPGEGDGQFNYPAGVAVDSSGNVYVTDWYNHIIQKFDSSGKFITQWGSYGEGDGQFQGPSEIAVDSEGYVYVTDVGNYRIQKFDSSGKFITKWDSKDSEDDRVFTPSGIAVDSLGNVYVAASHFIQKFDSNGNSITKWGSEGSDDGQFDGASGVAVDSSGNVYVAEHKRIQKFDSNGKFITKWGSEGRGDGQFVSLNGIAVDSSGNVYVSDHNAHRIQMFDSNGKFITQWGSKGSEDGQFNAITDVAVDSEGYVYVAEHLNYRIQKFAINT